MALHPSVPLLMMELLVHLKREAVGPDAARPLMKAMQGSGRGVLDLIKPCMQLG